MRCFARPCGAVASRRSDRAIARGSVRRRISGAFALHERRHHDQGLRRAHVCGAGHEVVEHGLRDDSAPSSPEHDRGAPPFALLSPPLEKTFLEDQRSSPTPRPHELAATRAAAPVVRDLDPGDPAATPATTSPRAAGDAAVWTRRRLLRVREAERCVRPTTRTTGAPPATAGSVLPSSSPRKPPILRRCRRRTRRAHTRARPPSCSSTHPVLRRMTEQVRSAHTRARSPAPHRGERVRRR